MEVTTLSPSASSNTTTVAPSASNTTTVAPTSVSNSTVSPSPSRPPSHAPNATTQPTVAPTTNVTDAPTSAPTNATSPPSVAPTKHPTDSPTSSPSAAPSTAKSPTHKTSIGTIIAKTIGWLILIALSVLLFGAAMSNRYQIYYALRGVWYTILQMECTRWIMTKLHLNRRGGETNTSLNEIIFDNNDLTEGLLMGDT